MSIFEEVRTRVRMSDAISFLGLTPTKREGDQWRFKCPACKGNDLRALSVNVARDLFKCFAWGKGGTDAIALVAHVKGWTQREAAEMLQEHFCPPQSAPKPRQRAEVKDERPGTADTGLAPLDYLETDHPVIEMLGLTAPALQALGGGFAPKGTMAGRLLIPLRMPDGTLAGYFGIATTADMAPLLAFPKNLEARCLAHAPKEPDDPAKPAPDELRKLFRVVG